MTLAIVQVFYSYMWLMAGYVSHISDTDHFHHGGEFCWAVLPETRKKKREIVSEVMRDAVGRARSEWAELGLQVELLLHPHRVSTGGSSEKMAFTQAL